MICRGARGLTEAIPRHSRSPGYDPGFSLVDALAAGGLLEIAGRAATAPVPFRQPLAAYVEHFHATASLARERVRPAAPAACAQAITAVAPPYAAGGMLEMTVLAHVRWGRPVPGGL